MDNNMSDQKEIIIVEKQGLWVPGWLRKLQMARNRIGSVHTNLISKLNVCHIIFGLITIIIQISIISLLYATHYQTPKITSQFGFRAVIDDLVAGYFSGIVCTMAGMAGKGFQGITSRRRFFIWMVLESLSVCIGAVFIWKTVYSGSTFYYRPDIPLSTRIFGILIIATESLSSLLISILGIVTIAGVTRKLYVSQIDMESFLNEDKSSNEIEKAAMNFVEKAKVSQKQSIWHIKLVNHLAVTEKDGINNKPINILLIIQGLLGLFYIAPLAVLWWEIYEEERAAQITCSIIFIIACFYGIVLQWRIKKGINQHMPHLVYGLTLIELLALGLIVATLAMCVVNRAMFFWNSLEYAIILFFGVLLRTVGLFVSAVISYKLYDVLTINSIMKMMENEAKINDNSS